MLSDILDAGVEIYMAKKRYVNPADMPPLLARNLRQLPHGTLLQCHGSATQAVRSTPRKVGDL
jgi:hypothetical protein